MDSNASLFGDDDIINANKHIEKQRPSGLSLNDSEMLGFQSESPAAPRQPKVGKFERKLPTDDVANEVIKQNAVNTHRPSRSRPYPKDSEDRKGRRFSPRASYLAQLPVSTRVLRPLSVSTQRSVNTQSFERLLSIQRIYEDQYKNFRSTMRIESDLFGSPASSHVAKHLKPLSKATQKAAAVMGNPPMVEDLYIDNVQNWSVLNPLTVLSNGFCAVDRSMRSQMGYRYMERRINRISAECGKNYNFEVSALFPNNVDNISNGEYNFLDGSTSKLEEAGIQIFRQMKQYMDFLSANRLPSKPEQKTRKSAALSEETLLSLNLDREASSNSIEAKAASDSAQYKQTDGVGYCEQKAASIDERGEGDTEAAIDIAPCKEEGELTDQPDTSEKSESEADQLGTYSPTPTEIEETTFKPEIQPQAPEKNPSATDKDLEGATKKKKKKRKKSKSSSEKKEHKKKKKEKKKEKVSDDLPKAYANNRNVERFAREQPFYRHRPFFRNNYNRFNNNRGFRHFRYNPNFRFQNRQNWQQHQQQQQYRRNYNRHPAMFRPRRTETTFVSESSSDDGSHSRRTRSRSPKKSRTPKSDSYSAMSPEAGSSQPVENIPKKTKSSAKRKSSEKPRDDVSDHDEDSSQNCALNLLSEYI